MNTPGTPLVGFVSQCDLSLFEEKLLGFFVAFLNTHISASIEINPCSPLVKCSLFVSKKRKNTIHGQNTVTRNCHNISTAVKKFVGLCMKHDVHIQVGNVKQCDYFQCIQLVCDLHGVTPILDKISIQR